MRSIIVIFFSTLLISVSAAYATTPEAESAIPCINIKLEEKIEQRLNRSLQKEGYIQSEITAYIDDHSTPQTNKTASSTNVSDQEDYFVPGICSYGRCKLF